MFRLPKGWSRPAKLGDVIVADGVKIHRAGIASTGPSGEELCGSAADRSTASPERAWFELAERVCTFEAIAARRKSYSLVNETEERTGEIAGVDVFPKSRSKRWVYARSNGVALHSDWEKACRRARWELAERDRILRAWLGEIVPQRLPFGISTKRYEWLAYSFPTPRKTFSAGLEVVGVFAFPLKKRLPLAIGFAARPELRSAVDAATAEAFQQLAFLWGAPLPDESDEEPPVGATLHLDRYQLQSTHPRLRRWLDGGHRAFRTQRQISDQHRVDYVDLTAPWMRGNARVAKAFCPAALTLAFGDAPSTRHLPVELRLHPIA